MMPSLKNSIRVLVPICVFELRTRLLALFIVTITITLTFLNVGVSPVRASGLPTDGNVIWTGISNPSSGADSANSVAVDATGVYVVGYDNSPGNYEWRIEKRSLTGGGLIWSQIENPSTGSDVAVGVAVDSTGLYVVGYDAVPGDHEWRIEKRSLTTGATIWSISENIGGDIDEAKSVAVDASGIYVVGLDTPGACCAREWRIEKRSLTTGAFITTFGISGVITENAGGNDQAWGVAVDASGMYVVGYDSLPVSNTALRIEKRSLTTGAFITTFGTNGAISEDLSSGNEVAARVAVDVSGIYIAGYDQNTAGNKNEWRVEKLNLTTGVVIWAQSEHISSGNDSANDVAVDASGVYFVGVDQNTVGNAYEWRVEKRNLTTGVVIWAQSEHISAAEWAAGLAVDAKGVYVVGSDRVPGDAEWRVEKRNPGSPLWVVSVQLYPGWNLVSLPVVPLSPVPKDVLAALIANGTITIVWSYSGSPTPSWKSFNAKTGTGTLTSIMDGMGLWIFMTAPGVLNVEGYVIPPAGFPPQYSLIAGWNLVGYKPQPDATVQETVSSYLPSLPISSYDATSIWVYDSSTGQWSRGDTTTLHPGQAFWILMKTPATLRP